jgi:hypothetical protein
VNANYILPLRSSRLARGQARDVSSVQGFRVQSPIGSPTGAGPDVPLADIPRRQPMDNDIVSGGRSKTASAWESRSRGCI